MATKISSRADVDLRARIGRDVQIGPFCTVGPDVILGDRTRLESHVAIFGRTVVGRDNRFAPGCVVGGEPQDVSFQDGVTGIVIGDGNTFREGVTVNRGAEKEDHVTRIGSHNLLMANSHVAHNCHVFDHTILVNGVLLGGHVHVHDWAIISGNSVVHHFSTLGTLAFVSGGCRVPHDVPPYMLAAGSDDPKVETINIVGMRRRGISEEAIRGVKRAHRLLYREHKQLEAIREALAAEYPAGLPKEVALLLDFVERQQRGKLGRGREADRHKPAQPADIYAEYEAALRRAA
jgi:UDP-N-acetylglucosamine acyltransferase